MANKASTLIPDPEVGKRCGRTRQTIRRWERDPALGFPEAVVICGRKYRDADKLDAWIASRARGELVAPSFGKAAEAA